MDIYSITVDETSGNNEENINAKEAIFELVLDNVIVTYEVIFTENIEQFEVVVSDTKVTYIVEPSTTFFSSGIGDAPDEQLYCRRNGQWVALAPVQSLELGNLHTNAYYGDLGKIAYDHSQATGNPHQLSFSGLSNKPTTVQGYGITDIPAWALSVSKPSYTTSEVTEADNLYFTQSRVLSTIISGYSPVDGNVNSSDSILSAINKLGNNKHLPLTLGSANGLTLDGQQLSLALASGTTTGSLSYSDWTIFNNKQPAGNYSTDIHENITALDNVSGVNTGDQLDILGNAATATRLLNARTINGISFDGTQNIVINAVDSTARIPMSYMGIANGVATLDSNGIIPITQLPSYVDDVIEVANYASLPIIGESGKIYVTTNNNKTYRWSGSVYVYITSGAVDSVNGYTGVVVLTKSDFILGNVDNTSDLNKPVSIATQSALNLKQNLLTLGNFTSTTPGITISNGNGAVIGSGITFNITTAGATTGGLITSGHWNTFNNKWDSSNHPITTLGYGLPDYPTTLPASDVYSWAKQSTKPTYSYSEITSKPTLLSQFTNDLGNYGNWITSINSGMITTALGYTPWHSGNHPTTISGYGITDIPTYSGSNFILNQNSSAQSANMWISGRIKGSYIETSKTENDNIYSGGEIFFGGTYNSIRTGTDFSFNIDSYNSGSYKNNFKIMQSGAATFASTVSATQLQSTVATGAPLTVNSTTMVGNLNSQYLNGRNDYLPLTGGVMSGSISIPYNNNVLRGLRFTSFSTPYGASISYDYNSFECMGFATDIAGSSFRFKTGLPASSIGFNSFIGITPDFEIKTGQALVSGNIVYHSGNLTNNLSTNYIPKWNGSTMVNSLISDDGTLSDSKYPFIFKNTTSNVMLLGTYYSGFGGSTSTTDGLTYIYGNNKYHIATNGVVRFSIGDYGNTSILSTTPSTAPTNGALVVNGGMGVGGSIYSNSMCRFRPYYPALIHGLGAPYYGDNITLSSDTGQQQGAVRIWGRYSNGFGGGSSNAHMSFEIATNLQSYDSDPSLLTYSEKMRLTSDGNLVVGFTSDQGYKLAVNGTGYFGGNVTASNFILSSDRTLKTNIQSIIKDYSRLNLVSFNFKNNLDELRFGTIAQDLLSNGYSEFVTGDKEGEYKVKYIDLIIAKLASAELRIKELEDKYGSR